MSAELLIPIAALIITLQGATLAYVVRIERRLTRLETIEELERPIVARSQRIVERNQ